MPTKDWTRHLVLLAIRGLREADGHPEDPDLNLEIDFMRKSLEVSEKARKAALIAAYMEYFRVYRMGMKKIPTRFIIRPLSKITVNQLLHAFNLTTKRVRAMIGAMPRPYNIQWDPEGILEALGTPEERHQLRRQWKLEETRLSAEYNPRYRGEWE